MPITPTTRICRFPVRPSDLPRISRSRTSVGQLGVLHQPRGLKQIVDAFALSGEYHWEIAMAASLIATLPMIAIFAVAQRYFLDGLATAAQKG